LRSLPASQQKDDNMKFGVSDEISDDDLMKFPDLIEYKKQLDFLKNMNLSSLTYQEIEGKFYD
jgi:hypothetical protein